MTRRPQGVAGVWVTGAKVYDGERGMVAAEGPGQVLTHFAA